MKQIKTIAKEKVVDFDRAVNNAIADGWALTKRELIVVSGARPILYAELEREEITEAERCCENCAHYEKGVSVEPCLSCSEDADKWEAPDA